VITNYSLYGGKVKVVFDGLRHRYTVDGMEIPGVTTCLSIIAKPALIYWSAGCAADYYKERILPGKTYDEIELETIYSNAKKAHTQKKTDAGTIGSLTHKWVERYIKGENPEPPVNEGIRESVAKFQQWVSDHGVKFLCSEQPVYSQRHNYIGTLDFICWIDGRLFIGDLKTSNGIYDEYLMQVAAYKYARNEEFPKENYAGMLIVRIGKDGEFEFLVVDDLKKVETYEIAFLHALELKRIMDSLKTPYVPAI
jgi:hypothetical protein